MRSLHQRGQPLFRLDTQHRQSDDPRAIQAHWDNETTLLRAARMVDRVRRAAPRIDRAMGWLVWGLVAAVTFGVWIPALIALAKWAAKWGLAT